MGLSALYFEAQYKSKHSKIVLDDIAKAILEKRRKLAPLILGGVITSLSLLSIILYSSRLEVVALAAFGLLLTYYGMQEHPVLHLEFSNNTLLIWLPLKITVASVRPFVAMLEYYISKRRFPILFARSDGKVGTRMIHYENTPQATNSSIFYRFGPSQDLNNPSVAVNPVLLDSPLQIYGDGPVIAKGEFLINQEALIENDAISYS